MSNVDQQYLYSKLRAKALLELRRRRGELRRGYKPKGACAELQGCTAFEVLISGPAGTGKSRACLEKMHSFATLYPRSRGLIVRKTRESLSESALFTFERYVLGPRSGLLGGPQRRFRQIYSYPNGSEITIGGMDKASKIMSTEYDVIYVQEAIELAEDDWESLTTRLRNGTTPYQQLLADTNPDKPTHWLKLRCDVGVTKMLESRHEDNPILYEEVLHRWTPRGEKYLEVLSRLTGPRLERLRHGRWVQAEGVVYEEWDPAVHIIARFEIPAEWRKFRVVDFGYTNAFCCQWWALDNDGRMYLYRELYCTHRTVRDMGVMMRHLSLDEKIETTVCDHDAEDRATLEENRIYTIKAEKSVSVGIGKVKERLVPAGDGKPRLFIMRDSLVEVDRSLMDSKLPWCTVQEFDGYIWRLGASRDEPLKQHDHGLDALRYATMYATQPRGILFS